MQQPDLTEEQFFFLKGICEQNVALAILPDVPEGSPERYFTNHATILAQFRALEALGFLKDANEQLKDIKEEVQRTEGRSFTAYSITEQTFAMFHGPEGQVN
jgi:hypothetical protein